MRPTDYSRVSPGFFAIDLFLSHNQEADVSLVAAQLQTLGLTVAFDDNETVSTSSTLDHALGKLIQNSRFIVSCQWPGYRHSAWCRYETDYAAELESNSGISRLLTLYLNEDQETHTTPSTFYSNPRGIAEMAAYAAFHNHPRVDPAIYELIRNRVSAHDPGSLSGNPTTVADDTSITALKRAVSHLTSKYSSESLDNRLLYLVRNLLLHVGASNLQDEKHSHLLDSMSSVINEAALAPKDSDTRTEVLYLAAILGVLRPSESKLALKLAAVESAPILREALHFVRVFSRAVSAHDPFIEFSSCRATALDGTARLRSIVRANHANFEPLESAILFSRMISSLLETKTEWNWLKLESVAIELFACLFQPPRPYSAKPRNLNGAETQILHTLITSLESLVSASRVNNGYPLSLTRDVYPDFLLPVLARGINSKRGVSDRFRAVLDYIHGELPTWGTPLRVVQIYDWYLREASTSFPTTHFREFSIRSVLAHDYGSAPSDSASGSASGSDSLPK